MTCYIPAVHRRTGYTVISQPNRRGTRPQTPMPSPMEQAFHVVLQEFAKRLEDAPDLAEIDAEGMCNTLSQLIRVAAANRRSA